MNVKDGVLVRLCKRLRIGDHKKKFKTTDDSGARALQTHGILTKLLNEEDLKFLASLGTNETDLSKELRQKRYAILKDYIPNLRHEALAHLNRCVQAGVLSLADAQDLREEIDLVCCQLTAIAMGEDQNYRPEQATVLLGAIESWLTPTNVTPIRIQELP